MLFTITFARKVGEAQHYKKKFYSDSPLLASGNGKVCYYKNALTDRNVNDRAPIH